MDNADRANLRMDRELELTISACRDGVVCIIDEDPLCVCVECGNEIEPARQSYRFTRCFDCALAFDHRAGLRA